MKYNKLYMIVMSILTLGLIYCFISSPIKWDGVKLTLAIIMCSLGVIAVIITYIISKPPKTKKEYPFKDVKWHDEDHYVK